MLLAASLLLTVPLDDGFVERVLPVLERSCFPCHSRPDPSGELDLELLVGEVGEEPGAPPWAAVRERMVTGEMPPRIAPNRPTSEEVAAVVEWIDANVEPPEGPATSLGGRVTLRRLNRDEYGHAVFDLLGVELASRELLPPDGVAQGYDVLGEAQAMPPILFEKLFDAAELVAEAALPPGGARYPSLRVSAGELETGQGNRYAERADQIVLFSNGSTKARLRVGRAGDYLVRVRAGEQHAGDDAARMDLAVDGKRLERFAVTAPVDQPAEYEVRAHLTAGDHTLSASFVNDYYRPDDPKSSQRDRNLHVFWIEATGPVDVPLLTPFQVRFRSEERPAEEVVGELARLLWRGNVEEGDEEALLALAGQESQDGEGTEVSDAERLRTALVALLASPRFLFRLEPAPTESARRSLDGNELATRLAAFLWSSVPDAELLGHAEEGALATRAGRYAEVERMLLDARASRLASAFAGQWLQLGRLQSASPDPRLFPTFDDDLRASMRTEVELFFDALVRERRPLEQLVSADFTFVDERLAKHYGIAGVEGPRFVRVSVPAELRSQRGGLLGMAGLLTATSNPNRTSPVLRGKWVLEALLATPPPPPPPGVGALDDSPEAVTTRSLRERLEVHRADPSCAVCHAPMDGLGFALEHYDAVGAWRERDGGFPVDASGTLADGRQLEGAAGLARVLLQDQALVRGLVRQMTVFALGRGLTVGDEPALERLVAELPQDPCVADVIHGIVELEAFRTRYREAP